MKLNDDSRRLYQVTKELVNPDHPFAKFSVGNVETLGDRNGQTIRQEILDFHQQQYSADLMTLTLSGNQPLEQMQQWVEQRFSSITNHKRQGKKVEAVSYTHLTLPTNREV